MMVQCRQHLHCTHDDVLLFSIIQDHEVLRAWLSDLHYDEYYHNFIQAGYDMPTITHMTPQDLTAIGISKPGHRKKLKAEIGRLNIHDGIPDFKPVSTGSYHFSTWELGLMNMGNTSEDQFESCFPFSSIQKQQPRGHG